MVTFRFFKEIGLLAAGAEYQQGAVAGAGGGGEEGASVGRDRHAFDAFHGERPAAWGQCAAFGVEGPYAAVVGAVDRTVEAGAVGAEGERERGDRRRGRLRQGAAGGDRVLDGPVDRAQVEPRRVGGDRDRLGPSLPLAERESSTMPTPETA